MQGDWYKPGAWNAICDVCGLRFKSDELQKDWRGLMVCRTDYETRHPQDFLRVRPDTSDIPWSRPEGRDEFIRVCYLWERTAYADLATADCARADWATPSYALALELRGPPSNTTSAIPSYAIPGYSMPGITFPLS